MHTHTDVNLLTLQDKKTKARNTENRFNLNDRR